MNSIESKMIKFMGENDMIPRYQAQNLWCMRINAWLQIISYIIWKMNWFIIFI